MPKFNSFTQPRALLVIGATLAGACIAFLLLPLLFAVLPNELIRSRVLLESLKGGAKPLPSMAILGNSIAMNGVDAKQLREQLVDSPVIWNLSSTGQLLAESLLIVDELPETVDRVLLTVFTTDLVKDPSDVPKSKMLSYMQYGYQPKEATRNLLMQVGPQRVSHVLEMPKWQCSLESRWIIRSAIDVSCRKFLRKDLDLSKATTDLFYPSPYTTQNSPASIETQILKNFPYLTAEEGHISKQTKKLLLFLSNHMKNRGISLCITILPEHSFLRGQRAPEFYEQILVELKQLGQSQELSVFSFLTLLEDSQFIDHIHPNADGAHALTSALAHKVLHWQREAVN